MPVKTICKRIAIWSLAVAVLVLLWLCVPVLADEWSSEAIVQGLAGLGGLVYWGSRSRSRVTIKLSVRHNFSADISIENVGNRVARQVRVKCKPPIPLWQDGPPISTRQTQEEDDESGRHFGPVEHFGDMDRGQRYIVPLVWGDRGVEDVLEQRTFEVSHESTWGFRRRRLTLRFGGGSKGRYIQADATASLERIARALESLRR